MGRGQRHFIQDQLPEHGLPDLHVMASGQVEADPRLDHVPLVLGLAVALCAVALEQGLDGLVEALIGWAPMADLTPAAPRGHSGRVFEPREAAAEAMG